MSGDISSVLEHLEKPIGVNRGQDVALVREKLASKQSSVEEIAGHLWEQVQEIERTARELAAAKKEEPIPDGQDASELFNDGEFRASREKTIHEAERIMGRPIFGENGYLSEQYLTDMSTWRSLLSFEAFARASDKAKILDDHASKFESIPLKTREELVELFKLAFADNVVKATEGKVQKSGITANSGALYKISEYLSVAPVSRKTAFELNSEMQITADGGLTAFARMNNDAK